VANARSFEQETHGQAGLPRTDHHNVHYLIHVLLLDAENCCALRTARPQRQYRTESGLVHQTPAEGGSSVIRVTFPSRYSLYGDKPGLTALEHPVARDGLGLLGLKRTSSDRQYKIFDLCGIYNIRISTQPTYLTKMVRFIAFVNKFI
jgi:hypothetical protein